MVNVVPRDLPRYNIHHDTSSAFSNNVPLTSVYLALSAQHCIYGTKGLSLSTESVILNLEMGQNILCYVFASVWLCGSASKWALERWC